jgi:hypothetical protein
MSAHASILASADIFEMGSTEPITLLYSSKVARYMNIFVQTYGSFSLHPDLIRTPWFL